MCDVIYQVRYGKGRTGQDTFYPGALIPHAGQTLLYRVCL